MRFLRLILIFVLFLGCENSTPSIKVAVSANMQYAIQEIITEFKKKYNCQVDLIVASSGKLTAQIEQGAPYDIFISADSKYPLYLFEKGLAKIRPEVYAFGQLVLMSSNSNQLTLNDLKTLKVDKIAIANPDIAPYGKASVQVLKQLNIYNEVEHKLIFGENILQVNQFIETGVVDAGITSFSIVKSKDIKGWTLIDNGLHHPIKQSAVIIKQKQQSNKVMDFYNYLFSKESQLILKKYGYLIPNE